MRVLVLAAVILSATTLTVWANAEKLVGVWQVVKAEGPYAKSNKGLKYTFNKDGTMKVSWNKGQWKLKDSELSFIYGKVVLKSDITFTDDGMLVIKIRNSNGQVLTLKKQ